jgi:hypothetical protein
VNISLGFFGSCKPGNGGSFSINSSIRMPSYTLTVTSVSAGRVESSSNPSVSEEESREFTGIHGRLFSWFTCTTLSQCQFLEDRKKVLTHRIDWAPCSRPRFSPSIPRTRFPVAVLESAFILGGDHLILSEDLLINHIGR